MAACRAAASQPRASPTAGGDGGDLALVERLTPRRRPCAGTGYRRASRRARALPRAGARPGRRACRGTGPVGSDPVPRPVRRSARPVRGVGARGRGRPSGRAAVRRSDGSSRTGREGEDARQAVRGEVVELTRAPAERQRGIVGQRPDPRPARDDGVGPRWQPGKRWRASASRKAASSGVTRTSWGSPS